MTSAGELLENPYERILKDDPLQLTPAEQRMSDELVKKKTNTLAQVATVLAGAFLLQHLIARRVMAEQHRKSPIREASNLRLLASVVYQVTVPHWMRIAVPALVSGYRMGVREAKLGQLSEQELTTLARGYAEQLGTFYNDTSQEALLNGFQAQLNRKIPFQRAAERVIEAYGVPPRAMNALLAVWSADDPKRFTHLPADSVRDTRARQLIRAELANRAKLIGESESWAAKSQAKQIVWMYGVQQGILPETARRTWVTAKDERVCKHCGPLHKAVAEIGEPFQTSARHSWAPPLHINCRCDVALDFTALGEVDLEVVTKAMGPDSFDRDAKGRFAKHESRRATPRPFAEKTKSSTLWEQVNAPSLQDQMNRALSQDVSAQVGQTLQVTEPLAPAKLKPLSMGQLSSPTLSPQRSLAPLGSQQLTPQRLGKLTPVDQKLTSQQLNKISLAMPEAAKIRLGEALDNIIPGQVIPMENSSGDWVPAEFPIGTLISGHEYNHLDDDVIIDGNTLGVRVGDRAFGGHDHLYHEVDTYWRDEIRDLVTELYDGVKHIDQPYIVIDDIPFNVDRASFESAVWEQIYKVHHSDSGSYLLSPVEGGMDAHVRGSEITKQLSLEDWVDDTMPTIVVQNHINPRTSELRGDRWVNPGKFVVDPDAPDLGLQGTNLPVNIKYVRPMDD